MEVEKVDYVFNVLEEVKLDGIVSKVEFLFDLKAVDCVTENEPANTASFRVVLNAEAVILFIEILNF